MGNIFLGPVIRTATPTAGPINTSKETKMNILIILAHPQSSSFNHAIAATAGGVLRAAGHAVVFHDLYAEGFDPVLPAAEIPKGATLPHDIQNHCDELVAAEGIVIVHPNWWGQPPAILKGWVDRVRPRGPSWGGLRFSGMRRGRRRAQGPAPGARRNGLQHLQHPGGARGRGFRRPPGTAVEGLHLQILRRRDSTSPHVQCHLHQYA